MKIFFLFQSTQGVKEGPKTKTIGKVTWSKLSEHFLKGYTASRKQPDAGSVKIFQYEKKVHWYV